jgi:hypothetical protein
MSSTIAADAPGSSRGVTTPSGITLNDLLAALPQEIEPVPRSRRFWFRLVLALIVLLSLLVVYITLVVITSYGVWSLFTGDALPAAVKRLFVDPGAYLAFCVAGPILCIFLVKPIFTMTGSKRAGVTLDRTVETSLFTYVVKLCSLQAAPSPRQIRVSIDVNASAGLRRGLTSLLRDDLELSIGLPLVRAMTLREFTGVLTHEFGHFAQGGAMRLSYLIRCVNHFLLKIAHERDGFDEALIEASRFRVFLDIRITVILWLFALFMLGVRAFLWLARLLMRGMAWVGLAASGALMREMEYDADRHEARVAGGDAFAVVGDKLTILNAARQAALSLEQQWLESRRLADDLPALVIAVARHLEEKPDIVQKIRKDALETTMGRFDTHPALRDRLAALQPITGAADPARCELLAKILSALESTHGDRDHLRARLALLLRILQRIAKERVPQLNSLARQASEETRPIFKTLRDALEAVLHPFSTAIKVADKPEQAVTIGAILGSVYTHADPVAVYRRGMELLAQLGSLENRVLSALVLTAEQVESALGLPPLPDPPPASAERPET